MSATISSVPRENIGEVWPMVSSTLDRAIKRTHGRFHNVDILQQLLEGTASLWVALRDKQDGSGDKEIIGSLVFVISGYPGGVVAGRIDYIAGKDRDDWFVEMWNAVCNYAKDMGCSTIEMIARPGTATYVQKWGGKRIGILMEYDLTKEKTDE